MNARRVFRSVWSPSVAGAVAIWALCLGGCTDGAGAPTTGQSVADRSAAERLAAYDSSEASNADVAYFDLALASLEYKCKPLTDGRTGLANLALASASELRRMQIPAGMRQFVEVWDANVPEGVHTSDCRATAEKAIEALIPQ